LLTRSTSKLPLDNLCFFLNIKEYLNLPELSMRKIFLCIISIVFQRW
jgi:hypothetical protein